jgi:hypothetical protein
MPYRMAGCAPIRMDGDGKYPETIDNADLIGKTGTE